jgi:hypothetical protein
MQVHARSVSAGRHWQSRAQGSGSMAHPRAVADGLQQPKQQQRQQLQRHGGKADTTARMADDELVSVPAGNCKAQTFHLIVVCCAACYNT